MIQIYQTHLIFEDPARCESLRHFVGYVEAESDEAALATISKITDDQEAYVLRVSTSTITDEIKHCHDLIAYWNNPSEKDKKYIESFPHHKEVIVRHQEMMILLYESMILKQAYQNFPHLRDKNVDGQ